METHKLKIRIGPHEFEAEGSTDAVQAQFEAWKQLVASLPERGQTAELDRNGDREIVDQQQKQMGGSEDFLKIFETDSKDRVRLHVFPAGETADEDALLLIAYGYRRLKGHDATLATQLAESLRVSGCQIPGRLDRVGARLRRVGHLLKAGRAKATKYRLTSTGVARAEALAMELRGRM